MAKKKQTLKDVLPEYDQFRQDGLDPSNKFKEVPLADMSRDDLCALAAFMNHVLHEYRDALMKAKQMHQGTSRLWLPPGFQGRQG